MRLRGKVALITGAGQGLGAEIARRYVREGARVFLADVNGELAAKTAEQIADAVHAEDGAIEVFGNSAVPVEALVLDVTSEPDWIAAIRTVREKAGRIDVLVNNAGINVRRDIEEMPVESFDAMFAVNVRGPFPGIKHVLPVMKAGGGGVILNMASICGLVGHKFTNEAYTTTKGAVTLLTKSIASRYAAANIRCNSVHPSTVDTPMLQTVLTDPEKRAERYGEIPLGRLASTDDVASAFVFLASDEATFINGVAFPVDGGLTAW